MRISELAQRGGVSVATTKYYLREGLLPAGSATARNQATYDEAHLHRLRLIRALREVGGLDIRAIRAVIQAIEDEGLSRHELFGVAQRAMDDRSGIDAEDVPADLARARAEVDAFIAELGWDVESGAPARHALADALVALWRLGREGGAELFRPYATAADAMASREVPAIPADEPRGLAVEQLVIGTVIYEAAFVALRRLAHEHHSARVGRRRGGAS
jgi:DNA-binding transcriptional MerR regulator